MDVVDEVYRLEQPVGKQYSYGRGPELSLELEKGKAEKSTRTGKEVEPKVIIAWVDSIREVISINSLAS